VWRGLLVVVETRVGLLSAPVLLVQHLREFLFDQSIYLCVSVVGFTSP